MTKITDELIVNDLKNRLLTRNNQLKDLQEEIKKIHIALSVYDESFNAVLDESIETPVDSFIDADYPIEATYKEKIVYILKMSNKALTRKEIKKFAEKNNDSLTDNTLSGNLSHMTSDGLLKTFKPRKMKGFYYCSPKWFNEEGRLMTNFLPDSKASSLW